MEPNLLANANSDLEIIKRLKRRDPAAVADLYDRYGPMVYSVVFRILGNDREAEGIVQEIFLWAWTRVHLIRYSWGTLAPWLLMVACRLAFDHLRAVRGGDGQFESASYELVPVYFDFPYYIEGLGTVLTKLTQEQQTAVALAYFEGLSHIEISERLAKPLGIGKHWARTVLFRFRTLLPSLIQIPGFNRLGFISALIVIASIAGFLTRELHRQTSPLRGSSRSSELGLNVSLQPDGTLHLRWLPNNLSLHEPVRAVLQISDGSKHPPIILDATVLRNGSFDYQSQTDDVDVRLTVYAGDRSVLAESARVVSATQPPVALQKEVVGSISERKSTDHETGLQSFGSLDPLSRPVPKFVLATKSVRELVPPPVVAAWSPPPGEDPATPVRGDTIASTGARLGIPIFSNSAP